MNQPVVEPGQSANVRGKYWITSEPSQLDVSAIHEYLSQHAYWAIGRSLETVERSIAHSLCCGLFCGRQQVGFVRLVTDYATYGYLCDVYILEAHRGLVFFDSVKGGRGTRFTIILPRASAAPTGASA